jgi:hypothetical protein
MGLGPVAGPRRHVLTYCDVAARDVHEGCLVDAGADQQAVYSVCRLSVPERAHRASNEQKVSF